MSERKRCLVMSGQPMSRHGLRTVLERSYDVEAAASLSGLRDIVAGSGGFDVAVLGLVDSAPQAQGPDGVATIRAARKIVPSAGILVYAGVPGRLGANDAIDAGALAFVATESSPTTLLQAAAAACDEQRFVDPAAVADSPLTKRQLEVLQLLADGLSTASVADWLGLSAETVRVHAKGALARLGANDRTHAVAIGLRAGLIE